MINTLFGTIPIGEGFQGPGTLGVNPSQNAPVRLENVISTAIGVMTVVAFIWFIIQFFLAAVQIIASSGDKAALEQARGKIQTSIIGLVVTVSAIFIIMLIGQVFGVNILTSITDLITAVTT